jgi:hypothetical protein
MHCLCYQCAQQHRIQPLPTCRQQLLAVKQRAAGLDAVEQQRIRQQVTSCTAWSVAALHSGAAVLLLQQLLLLLLLLVVVPWRAEEKARVMLRLPNIASDSTVYGIPATPCTLLGFKCRKRRGMPQA